MLRCILIVLLFCSVFTTNAQTYTLFNNPVEKSEIDGLSEALYFSLDKPALQPVMKSTRSDLILHLPFFNNTELVLQLREQNIFAPDFAVYEKTATNTRTPVDYTPGKYFRGHIQGDPQSIVTVSVFPHEINGIIRYKDRIYNFGKHGLQMARDMVLFRTTDAKVDQGFECIELFANEGPKSPWKGGSTIEKTGTSCSNNVEVYFECDYQMYQNHGNNVTTTSNYLTSVFNEVATIYANDSIPVVISQIVVWSSDDPYTNNSNGLNDFRNALNSSGFTGDLAHLVTNDPGGNGGVAWVDVLCGSSFNFAYSDINNTYNTFPTYSWDVEVITHEMGHNFGSQHTHDCVWGPNNDEQIDDCGNDYTGSGGACYDPNNSIIPGNGGTIMSYCHLLSGVGINFSNGFGPEPGALIRSRHADCFCDPATCDDAQVISSSGTYSAHPNAGNGANNSGAQHADWFEFTPTSNGEIDVESCNGGVDTRLWIYTGTCSSLTSVADSDDDCATGNGNNYASQVLDLAVTSGTTYYIEFDNRWSDQQFDWVFTFTSTSSVNITCPPDYAGEYNCDGSDYSPAVTGTATSTTPGATITYSDNNTLTECGGSVSRTWVATDTQGNSSSCMQNITLTDTDAPVHSGCPANVLAGSDNDCFAVVTWAEPTATDDCSVPVISSDYISGESFPVGVTLVTYTFADMCDNESTCSFTVEVTDQCTGPQISCPSLYTGEYDCNVQDYDPSLTGYATSSTTGTTMSYSDNTTGLSECGGVLARTWTATDGNGNTSTCVQSIVLNDTDAPVFASCPSDITVSSNLNCTAHVSWPQPSVSDDCTSVTLQSNISSGSTFAIGVSTVVYTATDNCGNQSTCAFNVTVLDACTIPCQISKIVLDQSPIPNGVYEADTIIVTGTVPAAGDVTLLSKVLLMEPSFTVTLGGQLTIDSANCQ